MNRKITSVNILACTVGALMTLTACNSSGDQPTPAKPKVESETTAVEAEMTPAKVRENLSVKQQVDFAVKDLATRMNLEPGEVGFSGMTPVTWRSGALGCPKPGMNYTDALVRGVLIMLRIENRAYRYHGIPGGQPFFCPDDRAEPPVLGPGAD